MRLARSRWRLDDFESLAFVDRVAEVLLEAGVSRGRSLAEVKTSLRALNRCDIVDVVLGNSGSRPAWAAVREPTAWP